MRIEQKAKELVTSAVHEALAKTYGPKILDRIKGDSSYEMMKDRIHEQPGKDVAEKVVSHIISQSPHDKYKKWMVHSYANGGINKLDDVSKTAHALNLFHKHSGKIVNKDIHSYKGFHDLLKAVEPFEEKEGESSKSSADFIKNGEATLVHESPTTRVVIPQTKEASQHFGRNTKWCTSATKSENYFDTYKPKGNLFYFLNKKANKRHAIFIPKTPYKDGNSQHVEAFDEEDNSMSPREVMKLYPDARKDVEKHVKSYEHKSELGTYDPNHPDYDKAADEIEKNVRKHIK